MTSNVISIDRLDAAQQEAFNRLMAVIPVRQREEMNLKRLIAVRLKLDGEEATKHYLLEKIEHAVRCGYSGSLFDFVKDDQEEIICDLMRENPENAG